MPSILSKTKISVEVFDKTFFGIFYEGGEILLLNNHKTTCTTKEKTENDDTENGRE